MGKTHDYSDYIGYIRVEGSDIENGHVDLQTMKHTVNGTERLLKHFLVKQSPGVNFKDDINFPVQARDGCWEILLPSGITVALGFLVVRPLGTYLNEAAKALGKNDIGDKTSAEAFKAAIKSAQSVMKIAKHLGTMKLGRNFDAKVESADRILLKNHAGEILVVTKHELEDYRTAPKDLFSDVAYPVIHDRSLHVGYVELGKTVDQSINSSDRSIFHVDELEHEELFPELEHEMQVELTGRVTRGNQKTNTIGFEYKNHILTCEPINSYVTNFINAHYKQATMRGVVSRKNTDGEDTGRPRIYFTHLYPATPNESLQPPLL